MTFTIQQALIPVEGGYATADVRIEGDRIARVGSQLAEIGTVADGRNKLLLPGFINAHTHSSEVWQRGLLPPLPLELWLGALYEITPLDLEQIYLGAIATAVETLLSGGTSLVDHLVLVPEREIETIETAVRAYREVGIRAFVAPLLQDEAFEASLPSGNERRERAAYYRTTRETLDFIEEVVRRFHRPAEGISILTAPTGIQLCSDALFAGCADLSDRYDLCRHSHLLETKAQQMLAQEKYGCSAVRHLHEIGYLSDRTSLAHCVWLSDADVRILAATRSTVVHNPLSNLRLGSGIAPILKYLQAGVNVAFGCDGASSNDSQDLLEAIKIGSLLHNTTDFDYRHWISPRQAIGMASLGAAKGLNVDGELGILAEGKKADLVLYDLTQLSLLPRTDPVGLLVLGRPSRVVSDVWVGGDRVVAAGETTRADAAALRQQLFDRSQWRSEPLSQDIRQLEQHYRSVLGLSA